MTKTQELLQTPYALTPGSFRGLTPDELRALRDSIDAWTSEMGMTNNPTQEAMASLLGIAPNTYARMERGELPVTTPMARLLLYVVADKTNRPVNTLCDEVYGRRLKVWAAERKEAERKKKRKRKARAA